VKNTGKYLFSGIDNNIFGKHLQEKIESGSSLFILMDENTKNYCRPKLIDDFPILKNANEILIKSGEQNKTLETCKHIWLKLIAHHADRNSLLINLGGGVISDLGGFAASCYKRGINFCNIPTTLLGMIDAAIGGKTGLDYQGVKNVIGSFSYAEKTFINPEFLTTLPERQLKSGYAELLKIALIADKLLWEQLHPKDIKDIAAMTRRIKKAVRLKNKIVQNDPLENNIRKTLNFGHTLGHAIESYSLEHDIKPLNHGEAVAIGMICESWISKRKKMLSGSELDEIIFKLIRCSFSEKYSLHFEGLLTYLKNDKKNFGQKINFSLLQGIGMAQIDNFIDEKMIYDAVMFYNNLI